MNRSQIEQILESLKEVYIKRIKVGLSTEEVLTGIEYWHKKITDGDYLLDQPSQRKEVIEEIKKCKCGCHKIPRVGGGLKIKCVRCGSVYLGDNKGFIHLETKYEKQNR